MNQRRQIFFAIHGHTFFIHVITHNSENLLLVSFYLPVCSIVSTSIAETDDYRKSFLRFITIEISIPVYIKMTDDIILIRLDAPFIKVFMGQKKFIEFCIPIKAAEIRQKFILIHLLPSFL